MKFLAMHITNQKLSFDIFGMTFFFYNFDPYNVFLAIATNIPQQLKTCAPGSRFYYHPDRRCYVDIRIYSYIEKSLFLIYSYIRTESNANLIKQGESHRTCLFKNIIRFLITRNGLQCCWYGLRCVCVCVCVYVSNPTVSIKTLLWPQTVYEM